jgi:thiol-disulfide isomerase/thioredoxin
MIFLHVEPNGANVEELNRLMKDPTNQLFILIHMSTCGPCKATLPEWKKMENVLGNKYNRYKNENKMIVADVDQELMDKLTFLKKEPLGFPTMWYITNKGQSLEEYEDSSIENKDRTIDSFVDWVESKMNQKGGRKTSKNKSKHTRNRKSKSKTHKQKGGKWSAKYKKSINCNRPKGFSQKQHCKYGRK